MRNIHTVVVHCSDTPPGWRADEPPAAHVAEIRRWHVEDNGWSDIGYHAVVARNGEEVAGRPLERIGAHVKGHNRDTAAVCLIGGKGCNADDDPYEHFTLEQLATAREIIMRWSLQLGVTLQVRGHNEYAARPCPGFNVPMWWREEPRPAGPSKPIIIETPMLARPSPRLGWWDRLWESLA
ncbi:MAG: N-acetylmuramoyl-L-alanine amidase [Bacteroidota bacterium]